ncbi:hypothetical protein POSPLADRAFT_1046618 [Postia placenta MAD-698-R-SB12]|uniref:Uncharacterized protein n=1 Tax=Postia placenta MAD-698-R-SB12 TaxID=670580 RepID=A0A1X6N0U3_9APHY|nr:hypothetical protein POSPLADRAFT_1046618 [Postia placenta MAD-698-R-SB12]OSX62245.1 hypothetical protein POSPLADRAFT_1046618 [Postia placenta MAD-698-R-SB12]
MGLTHQRAWMQNGDLSTSAVRPSLYAPLLTGSSLQEFCAMGKKFFIGRRFTNTHLVTLHKHTEYSYTAVNRYVVHWLRRDTVTLLPAIPLRIIALTVDTFTSIYTMSHDVQNNARQRFYPGQPLCPQAMAVPPGSPLLIQTPPQPFVAGDLFPWFPTDVLNMPLRSVANAQHFIPAITAPHVFQCHQRNSRTRQHVSGQHQPGYVHARQPENPAASHQQSLLAETTESVYNPQFYGGVHVENVPVSYNINPGQHYGQLPPPATDPSLLAISTPVTAPSRAPSITFGPAKAAQDGTSSAMIQCGTKRGREVEGAPQVVVATATESAPPKKKRLRTSRRKYHVHVNSQAHMDMKSGGNQPPSAKPPRQGTVHPIYLYLEEESEEQRPYPCIMEGCTYLIPLGRAAPWKHMEACHPDVAQTWKCPWPSCKDEAPKVSGDAFGRHVQTAHAPVRIWQCPKCWKKSKPRTRKEYWVRHCDSCNALGLSGSATSTSKQSSSNVIDKLEQNGSTKASLKKSKKGTKTQVSDVASQPATLNENGDGGSNGTCDSLEATIMLALRLLGVLGPETESIGPEKNGIESIIEESQSLRPADDPFWLKDGASPMPPSSGGCLPPAPNQHTATSRSRP